MISNEELSDPLCDSRIRGLTLVRLPPTWLLITEDANDLRNEGVTNIPKSGYKLSRVSANMFYFFYFIIYKFINFMNLKLYDTCCFIKANRQSNVY